MLTAILTAFYSLDVRAGSVDPRQLRMAMPFVKHQAGTFVLLSSCLADLQEGLHKQSRNRFIIIPQTSP